MLLEVITVVLMSLPVRGAWIEMSRGYKDSASWKSLPVRGAWIEI